MPELKNVFHAGRMNKDLDERLLPNGEYRDALNVDVSFSESNDAGSAQNSYGNIVKSTVSISGATCIGSVVDKQNETIIWFISGTNVDAIVEYNVVTDEVVPILVDTNKRGANAFLNFSNDNLITGANVLDEFLFFTDNSSEPKKINISRMKNGSTNFSTTTKYQNSDGTYTNNVYEELITVIKKYPLNAPKITLDSSIRSGNVKGVVHTPANTSYVKSASVTAAQADSQDYFLKSIYANTAGGANIYSLTQDTYIERVCNNYVDDSGSLFISFALGDFGTGNNYKKWRSVEPGMKVAISENGSGSWSEPTRYHTVETVDWINHTLTVGVEQGTNAIITNPADDTKVRISHWSEPYNNDYFWVYTNDSGTILPKPIGTSSENYVDIDGVVLKDGGVLGDGTGFNITLTGSDATSGGGQFQYEAGWSYNSGTKTYNYDGSSNSSGTYIYPKITKSTDLLAGHTYRMEATITISSGSGKIGFLSKNSNEGSPPYNGLNGIETQRRTTGTHNIVVIWKQAVSADDGMLGIFATDTVVGSLKINEITCLTKPRPVKTQPLQFYGNTSYEVNDIITLQAKDVSAVNYDDDKFVDISVKLTEKIEIANNKLIPSSHTEFTSASVAGNEKISNGDFSNLTTWHTGETGTTDVGTSSAAFYVTGGALTSSNTQGGYIRNVLAEALVAGEYYKMTYTVTTASSGSSGEQGRLVLYLSDDNKYTGGDVDYGHSNHILLPTHATGSYSIYWKHRSHNNNTELKFWNDGSWAGAIDNISVKSINADVEEQSCGIIGTGTGRQAFDFEILSIDSSILDNVGALSFVSRRRQPDPIYEKEFPRFSYRWKYVDNEYSAISPFTEVAFIPLHDEGFNYDSKNGYNKSMVNDLRRVTLSGVKQMPEDVKSIDILYKKSNSTSVYILRTVEGSEFQDLKTNDSIVITSEEIKSLLPENQMLRPYDNVPRKAKAQEITANRLIYGNYLQQYNYFNSPPEFKININSSEITDEPKKSLKSLRDYQVGVVYLDKYGRQSPVFTNESAVIKLDQTKCNTQNSIKCSLLSSPPEWATHFKYYVKDSANEFYNLAMDRFYSDTEDENIWISFPSSEINKVNENDYIALKKEHDSENAVITPAGATLKYKVLDKQAETPSHLKFKMEKIGSTAPSVTFSAGSLVTDSDSNEDKNKKYIKQIYKYPTRNQSQFLISAYDLRNDTELLEELSSYITNTGVWYDLDNRFIDIKSSISGTVSQKYQLTQIYQKTIVDKIIDTSISNTHRQQGVTSKGNLCLVVDKSGGGTSATLDFFTNKTTSKSAQQTVNNPDEHLKVGMRLTNSEKSMGYKGEVIVVTAVGTNQVTLSQAIDINHEMEVFFKDATDAFYFKTKKPFGSDIQFLNQSPQATRLELMDITDGSTNGYTEASTVLPNPQDLKLVMSFYKQTAEDYGEEFKGKFFVKIKRDGLINDFVYKTQEALNTFKSRDSARIFYAKTWLLDHADSNSIIPDTNLSTSSEYIKEILDIPSDADYTNTRVGFRQSLINFGCYNASNTRRIGSDVNGNGLVLNPETAWEGIGSPVAYTATASVNGVNKKINFGGTTRGLYNSTVFTGQNSINGYSMKELNYETPASSGGENNPMVVIDQTVGFKLALIQTSGTVDGKRVINNDYYPAPYVGDGWQVGRTNCTFKIVGINGFGIAKGNLGKAKNFFDYLKLKGQTFRFVNDPTNTVYVIQKSTHTMAINTEYINNGGTSGGPNTSFPGSADTKQLKYYEKAVVIDIELNKAIVWSPFEESDIQSQPANVCLELSTDSNSYAAGATITAARKKANQEKTASSNGSVFSACEIDFGEAVLSSDSPAVFEVLPKEKVDLNLFYETPTTSMIVRSGMSVKTDYRTVNGDNPLHADATIDRLVQRGLRGFQINPSHVLFNIPAGEKIIVFQKDQNGNEIYSQDIVLESDLLPPQTVGASRNAGFSTVAGQIYSIIDVNEVTLNYYNCFAFGNGIESNRIFDDYNQVTIDKGPRVSTILDTDYKEERKINGLIYSGIYNSKSSFNNLNQFIQGEKITKDLNPDYGSIQKLFTRNTNVVVMCEDKTLKVLANKDALFNADGNVNLTSTNNVLGQVVPFVGEYGISNNPESFASYGYRCYFTDRKRGAVLRLSGDGLTNIAEKGMSKFFRDNLDNSLVVKGSYDSLKDNYNVTLNSQTVSFTEKVNGWTSFKSFLPEDGISYSNSYYTFSDGEIYMHGENATRNNFYGTQYNSTLNLIFNAEPDTVKDFKTVSYEGDSGWSANTITTDKETGSISSFIEKEGKYFNFIKGAKIDNDVDLLKTQGLNVQGIGAPSSVNANSNTSGSQHVLTAVDIASNKEPKKWILNNSETNTTSTDKVVKINHAQGASGVSKTFDFYIHPQTIKGVAWKLSETDFTFTYAESISNWSGSVAITLLNSGSLKVRVTVSATWPTADTTSTLTMTAGSAYQEQI